MQVRVTKKMANEITKRTGYSASVVKFTYPEYQQYVTLYPEYEDSDYDIETELFSAIRILYPEEDYACPKYLTSRDLNRMYYLSTGAIDDFFRVVKKEIEI